MSDYDELIAERFPNEEQRAERRKLLHERLDTFLDDHLENDGSWIVFEDYALNQQFYDFFREIIDLKIERDVDGDSQFEISLNDRKKGRLSEIRIPWKQYEDITEEIDHDYVRDLTYAVSAAGAAANSISTEMESYFREVRRIAERRKAIEDRIAATADIVHTADFPTACVAMIDLIKDTAVRSAESDKIPALYAEMNDRFATERDQRIELAMKQMAPFETDNEDGWGMVRTFLVESQYMFGPRFGLDTPGFYAKRKDIGDKGYTARLAKRKAGIR